MLLTPPSTTPNALRLALDKVGDRWSFLILHEALAAPVRFDRLQKSLGIAPNILARRLVDLAEAGLLTKRAYQDKPVRFDYVATDLAREFTPVLEALAAFGTRDKQAAIAPVTAAVTPAVLHNDRLGAISLWERRGSAVTFRTVSAGE